MKKFSAKTIVIIAIGAALYGIGSLINIPVFTGTSLRPAVAILAAFAALFGPIVGLLVGLIGHLLTDIFGGLGIWLTWVLGSGIVGAIIGFFGKITSDNLEKGEFPEKDVAIFILLGLVANFLGYSVSAFLDFIIFAEPANKVLIQHLIASLSNTFMIATIGTLILFVAAKRNKQGRNLSEEK